MKISDVRKSLDLRDEVSRTLLEILKATRNASSDWISPMVHVKWFAVLGDDIHVEFYDYAGQVWPVKYLSMPLEKVAFLEQMAQAKKERRRQAELEKQELETYKSLKMKFERKGDADEG